MEGSMKYNSMNGTANMVVTMAPGFRVALYMKPSNSDRKSVLWAEHNLPIRRIIKYLIASRGRMNLTMEEISIVRKHLHERCGSLHTWGNPGRIQIYVDYRK